MRNNINFDKNNIGEKSKKMARYFCTQKQEGITLIALIITIIILLILAGVTIGVAFGEGGLLKKVSYTAEETRIAELKEQIKLEIIEKNADVLGKLTLQDLIDEDYLNDDGTIEINGYVFGVTDKLEVMYVGRDIVKIEFTPIIEFSSNGASGVGIASTTVTVINNGNSQISSLEYIWHTSDTSTPTGTWTSFTNGETITYTILDTQGYYLWIKVKDNYNNEVIRVSQEFSKVYKYAINNETLVFSKIIYIDAVNGNDTTGNGSESSPYKTVLKAFNSVNCDNTAIILKKGTYSLNSSFVKSMCISSYNNIYWIGDYNNTGEIIINIANTITATYTMKKNTFINIVFNRLAGGDNRVILDYTYNSSKWDVYMYNCVLNGSSSNSVIAYFGNNTLSSGQVNMQNCVVLGSIVNNTLYKGIHTNTAFKTTNVLTTNITSTTCLQGVTVDTNYRITSTGWQNTGTGTNPDGSQAHIGVYGGKYSW